MKLVAGLFQRRLRGFRIVDLTAFFCLTALVLSVYAFKAHAGGESAKIADVDSQIVEEQRRIRLLDADLARLEQPERLERLSTQYLGLAPVAAKHETSLTSLIEIAHEGAANAPAASGDGRSPGASVRAMAQLQQPSTSIARARLSLPQ